MVTGTDTGVGKTVVAAALAGALRQRGIDVGVMKPVTTGALRENGALVSRDAAFLRAAAAATEPDDLLCPIRLEPATAPWTAAKHQGEEIHILDLLERFETLADLHELLVVEGAGGIAVPINGKYLFADLASEMELPVLVVARAAIGTINHTMLTVHFAKSHGLDVLGIVINNYPDVPDLAEQTAPEVIERLTGVPVLGLLPRLDDVDVEQVQLGSAVMALEDRGIVERLMECLQALPVE
jgi:dethiobiotin synthetase